jgi:hypothetical protein
MQIEEGVNMPAADEYFPRRRLNSKQSVRFTAPAERSAEHLGNWIQPRGANLFNNHIENIKFGLRKWIAFFSQ